MIGFLPPLYEDELVYSWLARYVVYSGYPISIEKDTTIKAVAIKEGFKNSPIATFSYTVSEDTVEPTKVILDKTSLDFTVGGKATLNATVTPENADQTVTWTSSDKAVATVDDKGNVTAIAAGNTTITTETVNGLKATCTVTVVKEPVIDDWGDLEKVFLIA